MSYIIDKTYLLLIIHKTQPIVESLMLSSYLRRNIILKITLNIARWIVKSQTKNRVSFRITSHSKLFGCLPHKVYESWRTLASLVVGEIVRFPGVVPLFYGHGHYRTHGETAIRHRYKACTKTLLIAFRTLPINQVLLGIILSAGCCPVRELYKIKIY